MSEEILCTIHANNHVHFGKTLSKSFLEQHPAGRVFILLADERQNDLTYPDQKDDRITVLEAKNIAIPNFHSFAFKYNITQFACAVKPFFLELIFSQFKVKKLVFLDPDIYIYRPLSRIFELLEEYSVVLIPHIVKPIDDDLSPREVDIMRSGVYNLGFLGISDTAEARVMLKWWQDRLYRFCTSDVSNGYFHDQKWMDLVPSLYERVFILRETGYDVAYWNLAQRPVSRKKGKLFFGGQPLYFFHFSGIDVNDLNKISGHYRQVRVSLDKVPELGPLFEEYRGRVVENGLDQYKDRRYAYNYFSNGVRIHDIMRDIYRGDGNLHSRFVNPFEVQDGESYYTWLYLASPRRNVNNLTYSVMQRWDELKIRYRDVLESDESAFLSWVASALR